VDDGVYEGGEVSMFYDPMIAKLVTWAPTRDEAADLQIAALDAFEIEGLGHNVDFLSAIMQHPRFRSGDLTTGFIAEKYPRRVRRRRDRDPHDRRALRGRRRNRHRRRRPRAPDRRAARRPAARALGLVDPHRRRGLRGPPRGTGD
jgi:acetyl/propionyl-CoA carboxylase alpha subunit